MSRGIEQLLRGQFAVIPLNMSIAAAVKSISEMVGVDSTENTPGLIISWNSSYNMVKDKQQSTIEAGKGALTY